ncbi:MAG: lipid-A-disaccharide synthase [Bacteroidetes bacterium GWF2_33_16]|nr:MAG: lipid-A-disaccharide synthase [Bacteroidetes bacterium GWE2_32_14]OFY06475.1 MAG: lipid-A-disaccharide synthase [Bacteroidetes bacterium GWF2_33_16]
MRYYIIAGEASGDLHGSNLMKGLNIVDPKPEFRFWGGDLMQAQGGTLVKHYRETAIMGFVEVLMNIRKIGKFFNECKKDILEYNPDVLILIDYPGFNLRMAEFAKLNEIKTYYYISPKIWAWKESRIKKIKAFVDKMFVIFPFEVDYFKNLGYPVDYAGNPLLDAVQEKINEEGSLQKFIDNNELENKPIIAILAGSRKQEIHRNLSIMMQVIPAYKNYQFVLAAAPSIEAEFYNNYIRGHRIKVVYNQTYDTLKFSRAALVTSGTATLETALFNIPQVVCYRAGHFSYLIAKMLVKIKFISLVNLIMDNEVVKELIHFNVTPDKISSELDLLLYNDEYRSNMLNNYQQLREKLGGTGASERVAKLIYNNLNA